MKLPSRLTSPKFRRSVRTIAEPPWLQLVIEDQMLTAGPHGQRALVLDGEGTLVGLLPLRSASYDCSAHRLGVLEITTDAQAVIEGVKLGGR